MTDCVLALSELNSLIINQLWWSVNHQGIILHIIIVLHQRCLNCSECFQRHLMFYTYNYNIRVTHRNGAIKHIFYTESDPRRDHRQDCSLFILSLHALALHLAVKILLQIFLYEDLSTLALHTSVSCISLQNASRTALCCITNTIKWKHSLLFDINHQQNTRRSDQIETIKTIMQTTRPRITWKVLPMARVAIFKEIFDQVRKKFRLWIVLFWTKTSQRLTLYLLSSHR